MDNRTPTQRYWDESPLRRPISPFAMQQQQARNVIDSLMNDYPEDWAEGMEYYSQFHFCAWCNGYDHESNMIQDKPSNPKKYGPGWWMHPGCKEQFETQQTYLTKKQYESKINDPKG